MATNRTSPEEAIDPCAPLKMIFKPIPMDKESADAIRKALDELTQRCLGKYNSENQVLVDTNKELIEKRKLIK